ERPPAVVRDHAATLVEGDAGEADPEVPDAAQDDVARDHLPRVGRDGGDPPVRPCLEPVADDLDRLDATVPQQRDRGGEEAEPDPPWAPERRGRRHLA